MFQKGDKLRYGQAGLCTVRDVTKMTLSGTEQEYYVLSSCYKESSVVYVPVASSVLTAKLQPALTRDEAEAMLAEVAATAPLWNRDFRRRSDEARRALASLDRRETLFLMRNIYCHKKVESEEGRRVHTTDDYFLKDAEESVVAEFAQALGLSHAEALAHLRTELSK